MNNTDAIEQAYRNGYEDGKRDAVKHAHLRETNKYGFPMLVCSECGRLGLVEWKACPYCTAILDGDNHNA